MGLYDEYTVMFVGDVNLVSQHGRRKNYIESGANCAGNYGGGGGGGGGGGALK